MDFEGNNPKDMFKHNNFRNSRELLHNNIYDNVLDVNITEYNIFINSMDRNTYIYPNPFEYTVTFGPLPGDNTPNPTINQGFKNVKYIKIGTIILPKYTRLFECEKEKKLKLDYNYALNDNMYNILNIKNFNQYNSAATNDIIPRSFGILYNDGDINRTHYQVRTENYQKNYYFDDLKEINKMEISITDPFGKIPNMDFLEKDMITPQGRCICNEYLQQKNNAKREEKLLALCRGKQKEYIDKEIKDILINGLNKTEEIPCSIHNLKHPLNPIYQHHLMLKIGVIEPKHAKKIF